VGLIPPSIKESFSRAFLRACSIVLAGNLPRVARTYLSLILLDTENDFVPFVVTRKVSSGTFASRYSLRPVSGGINLVKVTMVKLKFLLINQPFLSGDIFWGVFRSISIDF
jgi:hypothetical protein